MKDFNKLEEHFNSLANEKEATPPPMIWGDIEKQLPKKKKNRSFFLILMFLGVCFSGVGLFVLRAFDMQEQLNDNLPNDLEGSNTLNRETRPLPNDSVTINNLENQKKEISSSILKNEKLLNNTGSNIKRREELVNRKIDSNDKKASDQKLKLNHLNAWNHLKQSYLKNKSLNNSNYNYESSSQQIESPSLVISKTNDEVSSVVFESEESKKELIQITGRISEEKLNQTKLEKDILELRLPILPLIELTKKGIPVFKISESWEKEMAIIIEDKSTSNWFFEIGSLIGIHNTHLTPIRDSIVIDRRITESNWYTWGVNASLGYRFSDHFYVKSGISFTESKDKFNFYKEFVELDTTSAFSFTTTKMAYFNVGDITYRQLNIPITIGGGITNGRFSYGIEGSALFNFKFIPEGKIQVDEMNFSRVENKNIYKSKLGLGFSTSVFLGYQLNESSGLYIKPTYSRYITNTNLATANTTSKLSLYYLEMTYRYRF